MKSSNEVSIGSRVMKSLPHTVHLVLDRELRILVGSPLTLYILDAGQGGDSDLQPV